MNRRKLFMFIFLLLPCMGIAVEDTSDITEIFDVIPDPISGAPDPYFYYIKKKYYTPENIEAGKAFFELNCAVCHGPEADGGGVRASAMKESKPRMLTNLDWSMTRDDLRLLRSIKYGVAGTAMTPWGDLTSSLQRLQLVIFIRSLVQEHMHNEELSTNLYQSYERNILAVENARIHEYPALEKIKREYQNYETQRIRLYEQYEAGSALPKNASEIYEKELTALGQLKQRQEIDALLTQLKALITQERDQYSEIGVSLLKLDDDGDFKKFLKLIDYNEGRYKFAKGQLTADFDSKKEEKMAAIGQEIVNDIDALIEETEKDKARLGGKIASSERNEELNVINAKIATLNKIKATTAGGFEEAVRLRTKQQQLFNDYKTYSLAA